MSVESLTAAAQAHANELIEAAKGAMADATSLVNAIGTAYPNAEDVDFPDAPPDSVDLTLPSFDTVDLELPAEPGAAPDFQDIAAVDVGNLPSLNATVPTVNLPNQPTQIADFTEAAPAVNTNIAFPEPPSQLVNPILPDLVLPDRVEPEKPQIMLPAFTALAPTDLPAAPTDLQATFDAAYRTAGPSTIAMLEGFVDGFMAKYYPRYRENRDTLDALLQRLMAGGSGLSPDVEDAIYSRARDKNNADARRVRDGALQDAAARGFTMPPGSALAISRQARQAGADNNARAAADIVVKQQELAIQQLNFAMTMSSNLHATMMQGALNYHQNLISINGQALSYATSILGAVVEMYNTALKAFTAKLDLYRAEATVYETTLKAALAGIELYRAEIDALQALTVVDRSKVEVLKARIDMLSSLANVYRSQIEAVQGRASLEKLKLELFQAKVQVYGSLVQAKNAQWQGYSAAIEGETAKVKIFGVQVDAYQAQIGGFKAGIDAKVAAVQAAATTNKARSENYAATVSGFSAIVQARGELARTKIEGNRQLLQVFDSQARAVIANAQVQQEFYRVTSGVAINNAQMRMTAQVETGRSLREFGNTIAQLGSANARTYATLASSTAAGLNTLVAQTTTS